MTKRRDRSPIFIFVEAGYQILGIQIHRWPSEEKALAWISSVAEKYRKGEIDKMQMGQMKYEEIMLHKVVLGKKGRPLSPKKVGQDKPEKARKEVMKRPASERTPSIKTTMEMIEELDNAESATAPAHIETKASSSSFEEEHADVPTVERLPSQSIVSAVAPTIVSASIAPPVITEDFEDAMDFYEYPLPRFTGL